MSGLDAWKSKISDSLLNLPSLDDLAEKDEYVHSLEFKVTKKRTGVTNKTPDTNSSAGSTLTNSIHSKEDVSSTKIPSASLLGQGEEGWDTPHSNKSNTKTNLAEQVSAALGDLIPADAMNDLSFNLESYESQPKQWSLLDADVQESPMNSNLEQLDKLKSFMGNKLDDSKAATDQKDESEKPKKKAFVPLSVVGALMSGNDSIPSYLTNKGQGKVDSMSNELDSSDDDSSDDEASSEMKDSTEDTNQDQISKPKLPEGLHYSSDESVESDLEDDFILGLHKAQKESTKDLMEMAEALATNSLNDMIKTQPELSQKPLIYSSAVRKKEAPVWFDVFDESNETGPATIQQNSSHTVEVADEENIANFSLSPSTSLPPSTNSQPHSVKNKDNFGWLREIAPPQLQSVSKNIASKWKEHKIGERFRNSILPLSESGLNSRNVSSRMERPEHIEMKKIDENEFVQRDSNSLLARDEQAEWERIKARSSPSLFQKLFEFWMEYDDYIFIAFSLTLMIYVYFYVNHHTGRAVVD